MVQSPAQLKYEIHGQPLIAALDIFQLRNDELGRDALSLMNERYAGNNRVVLDISDLKENQPIGYSNPFRRFALGPIVRELAGNDIPLLTPPLSELALKHGALLDATSTYEDLALVVYSTEGANAQLARHLVEQAKERVTGINFPLVVYGLKTVKDDKFPDGLRFDLGDLAVAYHVPILSERTGSFDANDPELVKTGFPGRLRDGIRLGDGSRILYTAKEGLRGVGRGRVLSLGAYVDFLPGSFEAGRVSFVNVSKSYYE